MKFMGFIDVQNDFMNANGALYVPGAESIKKNIGKLIRFAEQTRTPIFFTKDQHEQTDPEMNTVGGPFPIHCITETEGSYNILEAITANPAPCFGKRCYDVFDKELGNAEIKQWLIDKNVTEVWMAGVATDYCIKAAALGLRKLKIDVYIFQNAIMGVAEDTTEKAIAEMKKAGVHFVNCNL